MSLNRCVATWAVYLSLIAMVATVPARAEYFPEIAEACLDSSGTSGLGDFGLTNFIFVSPGPFQVTPSPFNPMNILNDPGYEHDYAFTAGFYTGCTRVTNLPDSYDDCPTAGILEGDLVAFSFGTYTASAIQAGVVYSGQFGFIDGGIPVAEFALRGQEVYHGICPADDPFCLEVSRSETLGTGGAQQNGTFSCLFFQN